MTTTGNRREHRRFETERRVAPHVDPAWAEELLLELRLQGVAGHRIGEVLTEVDSHCAESGEPAVEAFGDPVAYARSLGLPPDEEQSLAAIGRSAAPTSLQVLALLPALWGFTALRAGEPVEITLGMLVSTGVIAVGIAALVLFGEQVLRLAVHRPFLAGLTMGPILVVPMVVGMVLLDSVVTTVPAAGALGVGGALMVGGTAWELARRRRSGDDADPVTGPLENEEAAQTRIPLLDFLSIWLLPLFLLAMLALEWWLVG